MGTRDQKENNKKRDECSFHKYFVEYKSKELYVN